MRKKKPEMSQVYGHNSNEFVFGEHGGRGKNLLSFLRNLSLTGSLLLLLALQRLKTIATQKDSSEKIRQINSSIYGSMAYGYESPDQGDCALPSFLSASLSLTLPTAFKPAPRQTVSSNSVLDLRPRSSMGSPLSQSHTTLQVLPLLSGRLRPGSEDPHSLVLRRPIYDNLDDDWDADFSDAPIIKEGAAYKNTIMSSFSFADLFHPNLLYSHASTLNGAISGKNSHKNSTETLENGGNPETQASNRTQAREAKFRQVLGGEHDAAVCMQELRKLSWNGIPSGFRAITWQLLLGYLPTNKTRQVSILKRKRQEYLEGMAKFSAQFDDIGDGNSSVQTADSSNRDNSANKEKQLYHQINIDVKRTNQTLRLYLYAETQKSLKKILFLWAIRHPASGYVQGINDICTPFYQLFLGNYLWQLQRKHAHEYTGGPDELALFISGLLSENSTDTHENELYNDPYLQSLTWENIDPARLSPRVISIIEADSYWCISRLLDNITDNYIHEQPGIIKQVTDLQNLITKIDPQLVLHLENEGVEFLQFSFRWMNCLLMRELSIELVIRMWDTYLSETPLGFSGFHIYVCAAFLIKFSSEIKGKDFQGILLFLQNPPTDSWTEKDIELMLSEAFIWQSLYKNAGARLR